MGDVRTGRIIPAVHPGLQPSVSRRSTRLREAGVDEAHIPAHVRDAAQSLSELRTRLLDVHPEALELVDRGDFEAAAATLKQDCELRLAPIDGMRAPDEACRDAELYAAAAAIDQLNLDHRGAAKKYAAAARLVSNAAEIVGAPPASAGAAWRFRMAQGRALVEDGARSGQGDSLVGAIESYDRALDAVSRAQSPFAWAQTQFHRADALLAAGVNDNEPCRVEEAVGSYQLALEEWTHNSRALEWARAQHNLGDALQRLAEMEDGVERLGRPPKPIAPLSRPGRSARRRTLRHRAGRSRRRARHHGRAHWRRGAAARGDLRLSGRARRIAAGSCAAGMGAHAK